MEWPGCIRCRGARVVPGGPPNDSVFRIDAGIGGRRAWLVPNHDVQLAAPGWLCLDCGLVWNEADAASLRDVHESLRDKCHPEYRIRLFGCVPEDPLGGTR